MPGFLSFEKNGGIPVIIFTLKIDYMNGAFESIRVEQALKPI